MDPAANPPTTPIERLAAGLCILAAHGYATEWGIVYAGLEEHVVQAFTVDVTQPVSDTDHAALTALGWSFSADSGTYWEFPR